jgi:hypothetical protein
VASWFETREDALLTMRVRDLILRVRIKKQPMKADFTAKFVMPRLVPGIHVLAAVSQERRDGRDKPGHDDKENRFKPMKWKMLSCQPALAA